MNELFQAIYNKYNNSTGHGAYTNLGGRFYLNKAPQEVAFPYCVYFEVVDVQEVDFTDSRDDFTIQFNIFTRNNSASQAGTILGCFKSLFDDCNLTVTNWSHVYMQRGNVYPNNDLEQVLPIQGYSIEYNVMIEKTRS